MACYVQDACRSYERDKNPGSPGARGGGPGIQKEQDGFLLVEREGGRERQGRGRRSHGRGAVAEAGRAEPPP